MGKKALIVTITIALAIQAGIERSVAQQHIYVRGISANPGSFSNYAYPIVGFAFRPNKEISVGALGVFDRKGDGLEHLYAVGLWEKETQILLAQTTIQGGGISVLSGNFRWEAIPAVTLTAGTSYVIAAFDPGYDSIGVIHQSLLTHPDLDLDEGYVDTGRLGLAFPTSRGGPGYIFMGPNFATTVPLNFRATEVNICWSSGVSNTYRVEYLSEVSNRSWLSLLACLPSGGMETCIFDKIPQGEAYRLYRVIVTNCVPGAVFDPTPIPRLSIRSSEVEVCWPSQSGRQYEVNYASSLATNVWLPLFTNVLATGQSTCIVDTIPFGESQRLYRVALTTP